MIMSLCYYCWLARGRFMEKSSWLCLGKNLCFINLADFSELFPREVLENHMHKMGSITRTQNEL